MTQRALVLGGAAEVWDDVLALEALYGKRWDGIVVAVNDVMVHWPRALHHVVTLHPDKMARWMQQRARYGFSNGYVTWGRNARHCMRGIVPWTGGSSGMLGAQVAQAVGCTRVVLCGIPLTATQYFAETSEVHTKDKKGAWSHAHKHWPAWEREEKRLRGWLKSMSGRTRELLGAPDAAWLHGD